MSKIEKTNTYNWVFNIIQKPISTEKSTNLNQFNQYSFIVSKNSNSSEIKEAIQQIFKVKVVKVNTINLKGKSKMVKNKKTFKSGYKKAIITLKKGQSIDLATGI